LHLSVKNPLDKKPYLAFASFTVFTEDSQPIVDIVTFPTAQIILKRKRQPDER
jgi:hypothetical protein